jgi:hypothetical protein
VIEVEIAKLRFFLSLIGDEQIAVKGFFIPLVIRDWG